MKKVFNFVGLLSIVFLIISGCGATALPNENEQKKVTTMEEKETIENVVNENQSNYPTTLAEVDSFPVWMPVPSKYNVTINIEIGNIHTVILETDESDIAAMVERFKKELEAAGHNVSNAFEDVSKNGIYSVKGVVHDPDGKFLVIMGIAEHVEGEEQVSGNTGYVNYTIQSVE